MQTLEALKAKIAQLTKQAQAMESKSIQRVLQLMQKLGVTIEDLMRPRGGKPLTRKTTVGRPKYRDPATGKTWTGHGRAPGHFGRQQPNGVRPAQAWAASRISHRPRCEIHAG